MLHNCLTNQHQFLVGEVVVRLYLPELSPESTVQFEQALESGSEANRKIPTYPAYSANQVLSQLRWRVRPLHFLRTIFL